MPLPVERVDIVSGDIELYRQMALGWDLDFLPLDRGRQEFRLELVDWASGQAATTGFSCSIQQRGAPRPGWAFAVLDAASAGTVWRGREVDPSTDVLVFRPDREIDCVSRPGFGATVLTVSEATVSAAVTALGFEDIRDALGAGDRGVAPSPFVGQLRARICELLARPEPRASSRAEDLVRRAVQTLAKTKPATDRRIGRRFGLARRAEGYIRSRPSHPVNIGEVCAELQVSPRTLRDAFVVAFGIPPKVYFDQLRYHRARRELLAAEPSETRVQDVAARWGFTHVSRFASEYRRRFDELPSATLNQRRR